MHAANRREAVPERISERRRDAKTLIIAMTSITAVTMIVGAHRPDRDTANQQGKRELIPGRSRTRVAKVRGLGTVVFTGPAEDLTPLGGAVSLGR